MAGLGGNAARLQRARRERADQMQEKSRAAHSQHVRSSEWMAERWGERIGWMQKYAIAEERWEEEGVGAAAQRENESSGGRQRRLAVRAASAARGRELRCVDEAALFAHVGAQFGV